MNSREKIPDSSGSQPENQAESTYRRDRKIGNKASEIIKINREKAKKALYRTILAALTAGFAAGFVVGGASSEAKHNQTPLSKEKYESTIENFVNLKNADIEFEDGGSVVVTYSDYYKGRPTDYKLNDENGDAKFESGAARVENNVAGASFSSENGLSAEEAHAKLNAGLAQNIISSN